MKKILAMAMALAMALSMAACGGAAASSSAAPSATPAPSSEASPDASDPSEASDTPSADAPEGAITKPEDLAGKKIGVQSGTTGETFVKENIDAADVPSFRSAMDAALDLKNGRIDAVVIDELPAKKIVEQNPDLYILDADLATEEYAIAVKKGNTELLESINATIKRVKEDGTYEALVNSFMPLDGGEVALPDPVEAGGDKVIKMGTNAAFPPFEYVDGSNVVGFDISMSQLIAKDYGATLQVEDMAFDSLLSALQSGAIDFVAAGMSVTEERKQNVDFSDPYYSSRQVIILKK